MKSNDTLKLQFTNSTLADENLERIVNSFVERFKNDVGFIQLIQILERRNDPDLTLYILIGCLLNLITIEKLLSFDEKSFSVKSRAAIAKKLNGLRNNMMFINYSVNGVLSNISRAHNILPKIPSLSNVIDNDRKSPMRQISYFKINPIISPGGIGFKNIAEAKHYYWELVKKYDKQNERLKFNNETIQSFYDDIFDITYMESLELNIGKVHLIETFEKREIFNTLFDKIMLNKLNNRFTVTSKETSRTALDIVALLIVDHAIELATIPENKKTKTISTYLQNLFNNFFKILEDKDQRDILTSGLEERLELVLAKESLTLIGSDISLAITHVILPSLDKNKFNESVQDKYLKNLIEIRKEMDIFISELIKIRHFVLNSSKGYEVI